jgi:two-component system LytT family sensor kinase
MSRSVNSEYRTRMNKRPYYKKNDLRILPLLLIPFVVLINFLLFGKRYFLDGEVFLWATMFTFPVLAVSWLLHMLIAKGVQKRFYRHRDMIRRSAVTIVLFFALTSFTLLFLFNLYDRLHFLGYEFNQGRLNWALAVCIIADIFITVFHESAASFEKWKTTLIETEHLKKESMQSKLAGLKSQVSPHFLFNSLNTLSSLIGLDPSRASVFLDEMSKVYRYLLRNHEEQLVALGTELKFVESYFYLLRERYGSGVKLEVSVPEIFHKTLLPPLTLQILLDSILKVNKISKEQPLYISIGVNDAGWLEISNNIQKRIADCCDLSETGIFNISNKIRILSEHNIEINEAGSLQFIRVPLMANEKEILRQHESI